jgi:hypothetical protein
MGTEFDKIRIRSGNVLVRVRLDVFAPGLILKLKRRGGNLAAVFILYGKILPL